MIRCVSGILTKAALLLGAGLPCCELFAACAPEEFASQFQGSYETVVAAGQAKLLVVNQHDADLKIYLDVPTPLWLNSPGDRYGPDYVLLEGGADGTTANLCLYATFKHAVPGSYTVSEIALENPESGLLSLLRLFNSAAVNWLTNTSASLQTSSVQYTQLGEAAFQGLPNQSGLEFYSKYFAAMLNIKLRNFDSAWAILQLLDNDTFRTHPEYYKVLLQLGRIRVRQRDWTAGITYLEEALAALSAAEKDSGITRRLDWAEIEVFLAEAYIYAREFTSAEEIINQGVSDAAPDFSMLGRVINNKGLLAAIQSETPGLTRQQVVQYLNSSLESVLTAAYFTAEANDREILQLIENNVAVQYARMGERRKSLVHFLNVLRMMDEIDNPEFRPFLYTNLGNYTMVLGDYLKAAAYLNQAINLSSAQNSTTVVINRCRLGTLHRLQQDFAEALKVHQTCLESAVAASDLPSRIDAHLQISIDYSEMGNTALAETSIRQSVELLPQTPDPNLSLRVLSQFASVLLARNLLAEANATIMRAISSAVDDRYANDRIAALAVATRINYAQGNTAAALEFGIEALNKIEALHTELEAERLGPAWSNQTTSVFGDIARIYFAEFERTRDQGQLELAYNIVERSRDISLRQRLNTRISNDTATLEEQNQLALYSSISSLLAGAGINDLELAPVSLNYYHQHDLLSLARLNNIDNLPIPAPLTLAEAQARLEDEQLALYYLITGNDLFILTLTNDSSSLKHVNLEGEPQALLTEALTLLHTPESFSVGKLQSLSALLLPDLENYPQARELLIIGDASLRAFPFAALPLPDATARYVPLVARYALKSVPSLGAYFMEKPERVSEYSTEVTIIANPVFDNLQLSTLENPPSSSSYLRGWSDSLQALPYTAQEASNIEERISGRTVAFTGTRATRANLGSPEARNARILHIATHGYFKSTSEDNIGFALSTIDEQGDPDPGFITLTELFGNAFNNELVVISGCDTAMGKEQAGVGFNSLSRGFLAQGVKHVIATMWPVSDRASAEFMSIFYERLQSEKNVTLALQQTQQALSRNPAYRNPYYWAGYTLTSVTPDAVIALSD